MNTRNPAFGTAAMLAGAMIMGQVLFAGVSWWLFNGGERLPDAAAVPDILRYIWMGLCFTMLVGAYVVRQRIAGARDTPEGMQRIREGSLNAAIVQTHVVVMWGMLEGAGLLGIVLYFMSGITTFLAGTLAYIVVSALFFFPRPDWFEGLS